MVYDYKDYKDSVKNNKGKIIAIVVVFAAIFIAIVGTNIYLSILELDEIGGLSSIIIKDYVWKILTGVIMAIFVFLAIFIQNVFLKRSLKSYYKFRGESLETFYNLLPALISAIIYIFVSFNSEIYLNALKFFNNQEFGINVPIFNNDVGYYVFTRPFLYDIYNFLNGLIIFLFIYTIVTVGIYVFLKFSNLQVSDYKYPKIFTNVIVLSALFVLVRIFGFKLKSEGILFNRFVEDAQIVGASYVDVNIWLKYFNIMPYILIAVLIAAIVFLILKKTKIAAITIAVYPAIYIVVVIIAVAYQGFVVSPNEKNYEADYIKNNIEMTRIAYGLDKVTSIPLTSGPLTPEMIADEKITIDSVRVLDYESAIRTNTQLQSNTLFYTFHDGDILNYKLGENEYPVFISAREIKTNDLPNNSYINTTYRYTHGYGLAINPLNETNSQGQLEFVLSGLDHTSEFENLQVTRPQIYYGELTDNHVVVNANGISEVDYDGNVETKYAGLGGINLTSLNRLLFSIKYADLKIITSSYAKDATLLPNRQIIERAQKGVPFLSVDSDAYLILKNDGTLVWVLDAYTYTDQFPSSEYYNGLNYIRNSVKILIDAYDGKVEYYIIDETDPLIMAYDSMYPNIFIKDELPLDIQEHMKYPESLFNLQTSMLKEYHLDETEVDLFYTELDTWDIAKYPSGGNAGSIVDIESYYVNIQLPRIGTDPELTIVRPFTPNSEARHNMVSWLSARNSYENYGELILYEYPKNTNVFGPYQIEVKINQIDKISEDMTLWGQSGSDVYKGSLLIVPIGESILYVEPIYIKADGSSAIPEVREIVVGYQLEEQFIYGIGNNVETALVDMFTKVGVTLPTEEEIEPDPNAPETNLDEETLKALQDMYNALQSQLDELGEILDTLGE